MITRAVQPSMSELYGLIQKVPSYPLSVRRLLKLANQSGASDEVLGFYKAFAPDQVFDNEDDLAGRTEQMQIIQTDKGEMPSESLQVPQED